MRSLSLSLLLATALVPVAGCLPTIEDYIPPVTAYQPPAQKVPVKKATRKPVKTAPVFVQDSDNGSRHSGGKSSGGNGGGMGGGSGGGGGGDSGGGGGDGGGRRRWWRPRRRLGRLAQSSCNTNFGFAALGGTCV